ncbi:Alpha/Beta hydrolase protein [Paraphysoderma sedebokerense]|nr:Alpha/Beta hydrolase protein [Paraphysoderma sedebokerense]
MQCSMPRVHMVILSFRIIYPYSNILMPIVPATVQMRDYVKQLTSVNPKTFGFVSSSEVSEGYQRFSTRSLQNYTTWGPAEIMDAQMWAKYAGATYCLNESSILTWTCGDHCRNGTEGTRISKIFYAGVSATKGFVALNQEKSSIVVSFRGSLHPLNWMNDFLFDPVPLKTNVSQPNLKVHRGFQDTFEPVREDVLTEVRQALQQNPTYTVHVTGHSLGGAVANLAAIALKQDLNLPDDKLILHTFAAPRTGDISFANWMTSQKFKQFRIVNKNDLVPKLPPPPVYDYRHASTEIWFQDSKAYVCDKTIPEEDPACSASTGLSINILEHLGIFDNVLFGPWC